MLYTWSHLGDTVSNAKHQLYYRGQRIKEAYYRGEKIWDEPEFLGIEIVNLPDKRHYPPIDKSKSLINIEVINPPDKTDYKFDEVFDYSGLKVVANYEDGHFEDITSRCEFTQAPENGVSELQLEYGNKQPGGNILDYTGIKIFGIWEFSHAKDITEKCEFYLEEGASIDTSAILIGIIVSGEYPEIVVYAVYADGHTEDVTSECSFEIAGRASLSGILATTLPNKSTYTSGDTIEYDGTTIMALYSNGRATNVTDNCEFTPSNA